MPDLDLKPIMARYSKALDAKPGKGPISEAGIAAITDSVCDVPELLAEVERLREQNTRYATRLATYRESMQQLDPNVRRGGRDARGPRRRLEPRCARRVGAQR